MEMDTVVNKIPIGRNMPVYMNPLVYRTVIGEAKIIALKSKVYDAAPIAQASSIANVEFEKMDTVTAILNYAKTSKTTVLNFASYVEPGGGCLRGATAQEESLCYESNLYFVLKEFKEFYENNRNHLNRELYTNRAIYSPGIEFARKINYGRLATYDEPLLNRAKCDVITCAAPFAKYAINVNGVSRDECIAAMDSRIKFILSIASENNIDTLILGAFGCGEFGNDPMDTAKLFKKNIEACIFNGRIIFAIPDEPNYSIFNSILNN